MVRASHGFRHKTRQKLKKSLRVKFKPNMFITDFKPGDSVVIKQNPLSQCGMPHPRFKSLVGQIVGKRGNAYVINVRTGKAVKHIIARGEHLKPANK